MSTPPNNASNPPAPHTPAAPAQPAERPLNFIEQIVEADNAANRWGKTADGKPRVQTRFPPEPNGYLHLGHAKSICLNSGLAKKYGGKFNLRFDDTNPSKEEQEYVDSITNDVKWLGAEFEDRIFWASDYFDQMYLWAEDLIKKGLAYVCDLPADEVSKQRGIPQKPGIESPYRSRTPDENLRLFREMRDAKHPNGAKTLRAKIDMASPNLNLRDPVMYRILHEAHHNTGTKWCLYPMYDWAHGLEDSIEQITHSICTLEFENHRPLYDWFLKSLSIYHPQQIEFAKLNLTYTVMSKRFLLKLVESGQVSGWDDPRMPTLAGVRRRGYTPQAIRDFCDEIGVTKQESVIDVGRLENSVRAHLNKVAPRAMSVLRPLKVVIENWPEGTVDELDFVVNPEDASAGTRKVKFGREIYIEREDFMEVAPKKFFRLAVGQEVRLRWAYFITATKVVKDDAGNILEVHATYDPATRGGDSPVGPDGQPTKKVKGTLHWVNAADAFKAEVRLFDRLFKAEKPGGSTGDYMADLNPNSLEVVQGFIDPALKSAKPGETFQFERMGYFCVDKDSKPGQPIFNRTVTLKDGWAKDAAKA